MSSDDDDYYVDDPFDKPMGGARGGGKKKSNNKKQPENTDLRTQNNRHTKNQPTTPQAKKAHHGNNNNNVNNANAFTSSVATALDNANHDKEHYLTPADKILARLKWDDVLDVRDFEIGYDDRFVGLMHMPAARFRGDDGEGADGDAIPFHRVEEFRYKGRVVWDKKSRLNLIDDLAEEVRRILQNDASQAEEQAATGLTSLKHMSGERLKIALPKNDAAAHKNAGAQQQKGGGASSSSAPTSSTSSSNKSGGVGLYQQQLPDGKSLKVVSYNILHDIFDASEIYTDLRIPFIAKELLAQKPDVIFLQEATIPRIKQLLDGCAILKDNFYWTALPSMVSSSQIIGTRFPIIEAFAESISRNKRRVFALMENPWAKERGSKEAKSLPICLVNVHFLSDHGAGDSIARRFGEVKSLNQNLSGFPRVIVAGDFNFGDQNPESSVEFKDCKDAWLEQYKTKNNIVELPNLELVRSGQVPKVLSPIGGFTFDITRNPLANLSCEHHRYPRRLDRILYRAFNPVIDSVKVIAIEPYPIAACTKEMISACRTAPPSDGNIYPSDHFGVCAEFKKDDATFSGAGAAAVGSGISPAVVAASQNNNNNDDDADANTTHSSTNNNRQVGQPVPFNATKIDPVVASMARAGGFGKHYRSALVFLPPPALYERINRFRANGRDKAYPRWPCHTTILFPFVSPGKFGDAINLIEAAMKTKLINVEPFRVKLRKIGMFPRGNKSVVFLEPECVKRTDSTKDLGILPMKAVFEPLQYLFPQCGRGGGDKDDDNDNNNNNNDSSSSNSQTALAEAYHPHFTLGMTHNQKDHKQFIEEINEEWEPVEFDVSQFHLIAHLDGKDGFEVIHTFDLGTSASSTKANHDSSMTFASKNKAAGSSSSSSGNQQQDASSSGKVMATVLEAPKWGSRFLSPYAPADPLEQWMCLNTISKYARDAPTHISQRGGMYHIPSSELDQYLRKWKESYLLRENVAGYLEEVRGNPFRLYLDLDFDLSAETPVEKSYALDLCREICILTAKIFAGSDSTVAVFECHGSASKKFANGTVPDSDEEKHADAAEVRVGKSGYRLYFQRIFVDHETYDKYLDAVSNYLRRKQWSYPENAVRGVQWDEIVDKKASAWDRGRLLGTIKRRKNLKRIYEFMGIVTIRGTHEVLSKEFNSSILRQLYASTLRLWEVLPKPEADGKSVLMDNEFTTRRLYSWDSSCEANAATAHTQ